VSRPDDATDRDDHLLAALRHAPDRDALPPPAVSAAILARAREQARRPASPHAWQRWFDAWRLTPHRAAAFGSVAVAVLVGVMWSVNDPVPPPPASAVEAVRVPAAPMPSAAVVVAAPAAPLPPPPSAKRASEKRAEPAKAAPLHDAAPVVREVAPAPGPATATETATATPPSPACAARARTT
jgi:hypothetical protein